MPRAAAAPKPAKPAKSAKKAKANGYEMASPIPEGEIIQDLAKRQWKLGPSIGKGGFGEIYSAQEANSGGKKSSAYPYVIKIEPHANGPLFVERNFYIQNARPEDVEEFKNRYKLKSFGMPIYWGSGSHEINGEKLRFLIMDKFGTDLDKLLKENKGSFPVETVFKIALQMTYVLEYVHSLGYVHADLKGANILMGVKPDAKNQAYLVDFGMASKFSTDKEFKPNPKYAHNGTIEYLSRDAHHGVSTRRGDFEILAYNLTHWLGGKLPWLGKLKDPKVVHSLKDKAFEDIPKFLKTCLGDNVPSALAKFFKLVKDLEFDQEPDYKKIKELFKAGIKDAGGTPEGALKFSSVKGRKRKTGPDNDPETAEKVPKGRVAKQTKEEPMEVDVEDDEPELFNGEPMNDGIKEVLAKKEAKTTKAAPKKRGPKKAPSKAENGVAEEDEKPVEEVMTPAMLAVLNKKKEKAQKATKKTTTTRKPKAPPKPQNGHVSDDDDEAFEDAEDLKKSKPADVATSSRVNNAVGGRVTRSRKC